MKDKSKETERRELEEEIKNDARKFILDSIDSGMDAAEILDELASFYDGDPCELF